MKASTLVIAGVLVYLYLDNFSLTVETTLPEINSQLNLPKQVPLKDLIFNLSNTPSGFIRVYISPTDKNRLL